VPFCLFDFPCLPPLILQSRARYCTGMQVRETGPRSGMHHPGHSTMPP
jgi:hypothetical protein